MTHRSQWPPCACAPTDRLSLTSNRSQRSDFTCTLLAQALALDPNALLRDLKARSWPDEVKLNPMLACWHVTVPKLQCSAGFGMAWR